MWIAKQILAVVIMISCTVLIAKKYSLSKEYEKLQEWEKRTQMILDCQESRTKGGEFPQEMEIKKIIKSWSFGMTEHWHDLPEKIRTALPSTKTSGRE